MLRVGRRDQLSEWTRSTMAIDTPIGLETAPVFSPPAPAPEVAISVRGAGKMYRIYDRPQDRLKQMLWRGRRKYGREFWALRDVSFELRRGEMIGIIGRNGSGKSTLLQIIAGTLAPSEGEVTVNGRVAALLELGSGFNPEFTGRENVFLNGSILGISREEIQQRFDDIAAFADIGEFIEQPVKTYSSGMMVRLAFAVQASIEPDVLIIDEALAVGDVFFRQKCYRRLEELRSRGVSILVVSHAMMDIEQLCQRVLLVNAGEVIFQGSSSEAVKRYYLLDQQHRLEAATVRDKSTKAAFPATALTSDAAFWPTAEAFLNISDVAQVSTGWARCTGFAICDTQGQPCQAFQQGEQASFYYEFEVLQDIGIPLGGLTLQNDHGVIVHGKSTLEYGSEVPMWVAQGTLLRFQQDITLDLATGEYTLEVGLATMNQYDYMQRELLSHTELRTKIVRLCHPADIGRIVVLPRKNGKPIQLLHHGVANLPGSCRVSIGNIADATPLAQSPLVSDVTA
jgi:lipopolysaccharide transport system ATP-binding protein